MAKRKRQTKFQPGAECRTTRYVPGTNGGIPTESTIKICEVKRYPGPGEDRYYVEFEGRSYWLYEDMLEALEEGR